MTVVDDEERADAEHVTQLHALLERLGTTHEHVSGLFAAVLSGPNLVPPAEWLPEVIGDYAIANEEEAREIIALVMTLYQDVMTVLKESPEALAPGADDIDGIKEFCAGYLLGSRMHPQWLDDEVGKLRLLPMAVLSGEFPIEEVEGPDDKPLADHGAWLQMHREKLGQYVGDIDAHFEPKRQAKTGPKVGRNDPCPCGSGKKHKKCCLQ